MLKSEIITHKDKILRLKKEDFMSDNVIEFPKSFSQNAMVDQLTAIQIELSNNYQKVMENYQMCRQLELESGNLQKRYDEVLLRYAELIGHENVPAGMMEYSTHIVERGEEEEIVIVPPEVDSELKLLQDKVTETMNQLAIYLQGIGNDELQ